MTDRKTTSIVPGVLALLMAALIAVGCGDAPPAATDPSAAKGLLVKALDVWKAGDSKDSLNDGTSTFLVNDPDWERSAKLVGYDLAGEGQPLGAGVQWAANLTLAAKGKTVKKKAVYVVNVADASVTVSRQDMDF